MASTSTPSCVDPYRWNRGAAAYATVRGTTAPTYTPNAAVTRGQLATYVAGILAAAGHQQQGQEQGQSDAWGHACGPGGIVRTAKDNGPEVNQRLRRLWAASSSTRRKVSLKVLPCTR
jgi:hypothetical protein